MTSEEKETAHPNEVDLRRIRRLLEKRERYHYVSPSVQRDFDGYRIVSPCCSRNVDQNGGVIDIALIEYDSSTKSWILYRKDHPRNIWTAYMQAKQLHQLMDSLNIDSDRVFWQ